MEKSSDSKSIHIPLTLLIIAGAFLLRMTGLGGSSLTMNEAENAMAALRLFGNGGNSQLLYTLPTALFFKMFGSSEFTARLFPALMGCLLAGLPLVLKNQIGNRKAFILGLLLAADPVLIFWSKRADAVIPAVTLFAAVFVCLQHKRNTAAMACLLIGLCGGERSWPGLVLIILCCILTRIAQKSDAESFDLPSVNRMSVLFAAAAFILFCCAFGTFPGGFGCFGAGFVSSFTSGPAWQHPGLTAELAAFALYCCLPFLFCLSASVRSRKLIPLLISGAGCAAVLLWQGIVMLPWIMILLWYHSADELLRLLSNLNGEKNYAFYTAACVIPGAYAFFYFRLVELFSQQNGNDPIQIMVNGTMQTLPLTRFWGTVLLMAASLLIIALVIKILLGYLESDGIRRGMLFGCMIIISWIWMTEAWNAGGFDRIGDHPAEPHLENTINVLNGAYTAYTHTALFEFMDETVSKHGDAKNTLYGLNLIPDDPMLDWYFRTNPGFRTTANRNVPLTGVDIILDRSEYSFESYGFAKARLNWRGTMNWKYLSFRDWGRWLIFGDAVLTEEAPLNLWVKSTFVFSE